MKLLTRLLAAALLCASVPALAGAPPIPPSIPMTIPGTPIKIGEGRPLGNPTGTITATTGAAGVLTGAYKYCYTETDDIGETACSPVSTVVNPSAQKVQIVVPEPRRGTETRRVYRTAAGGSTYLFLYSFGGGGGYFQTTYLDNTPDGSLGAAAPAVDGSNLYSIYVSKGVKEIHTHPDQAGAADWTYLTGDSGYTAGAYAIDIYAQLLARTYLGDSFSSLKTGNNDGHFLCQWQDVQTTSAPTTVCHFMPHGNLSLTPTTLSDPSAADGMGSALNSVSAFGASNTATANANVFNATGAGSAAFDQNAMNATFLNGYTGTAYARAGLFQNGNNATGGYPIGLEATYTGTTGALAVGLAGRITGSATKYAGVFASTGGGSIKDAYTWPGGVNGAAILGSNGSNTDDLMLLYNGGKLTNPAYRVDNNGNLTVKNPQGSGSIGTITVTNSGGGCSTILDANSGNQSDVGTSNNCAFEIKTNNTVAIHVTTSQTVTIGNTTNAPPAGIVLDVNGPTRTKTYTVAGLPTCGASQEGARAGVTDATAPTWGSTLTGGGAVHIGGYCNGTAWIAD